MVERICPQCQYGNPLEHRFCGHCGASLDRNRLDASSETSLTIAGRQLPARQLKQVGQALAVSLAALAAEAGLAWLRRRVDRIHVKLPPALAIRQSNPVTQSTPTALVPTTKQLNNTVTIVSQRVVEVWEQGNLTRQMVERAFWRREG